MLHNETWWLGRLAEDIRQGKGWPTLGGECGEENGGKKELMGSVRCKSIYGAFKEMKEPER